MRQGGPKLPSSGSQPAAGFGDVEPSTSISAGVATCRLGLSRWLECLEVDEFRHWHGPRSGQTSTRWTSPTSSGDELGQGSVANRDLQLLPAVHDSRDSTTPSGPADQLGIQRSAVSRSLGVIQHEGLVRSACGPDDRRSRRASLTPKRWSRIRFFESRLVEFFLVHAPAAREIIELLEADPSVEADVPSAPLWSRLPNSPWSALTLAMKLTPSSVPSGSAIRRVGGSERHSSAWSCASFRTPAVGAPQQRCHDRGARPALGRRCHRPPT